MSHVEDHEFSENVGGSLSECYHHVLENMQANSFWFVESICLVSALTQLATLSPMDKILCLKRTRRSSFQTAQTSTR